ncbi:hypothetical protein VW35_04680 [Devosia soli]|uniref:Uncharacterized protein n=1 Tax=Devosia soli TaxID=361041 RepID=A0A0F5LBM9_9HYPH|nr:hypothetical protein [Devosia soli]KKB79801.1 hypothetical protein VW35_04680 [Devosia soli]
MSKKEPTMTKEQSKPAPLETGAGEQMDDNVDDLGKKANKPEKVEQPTDAGAQDKSKKTP